MSLKKLATDVIVVQIRFTKKKEKQQRNIHRIYFGRKMKKIVLN